MSPDSQPTVAEAVEAAQIIKRTGRLCGWFSLVSIVCCVTVAYYEPLILVALGVSLLGVWGFHARRCEPKQAVLRTFAKNRNWFLTPGEELRHVEGSYRRKRFYADPVLIPIDTIIERVGSGDFSSHPAPPKGEVPRKPPSRRSTGEEEKRRAEEARQRAEEEKRRAEEARQRAEEEKRRAEELRRRFEEPRFRIYIGNALTDLMSVKEVWRILADGNITLANYGMEKGSTVFKQLDQFPDLAALCLELIIANKEEQRTVHRRDQREKAECIKFHGTSCAICGFSFEDVFGEIGEGYIEVHHLKPVAEGSNSVVRIVNPVADLRPVCANCHRMLHKHNPPYSIEELIAIRSMQSVV